MEVIINQSVVKPEVWFLHINNVTLELREDDIINLFRACAKTEIGIEMLARYKK